LHELENQLQPSSEAIHGRTIPRNTDSGLRVLPSFDLQQLAEELMSGLELVLTEEEEARLREGQEANRSTIWRRPSRSPRCCLLDYGAYPEAFGAIQGVQRAAGRRGGT
jgi:hypothetical protein